MPNGYNSEFTGQHNDDYNDRITAVEAFGSRISQLETELTTIKNKLIKGLDIPQYNKVNFNTWIDEVANIHLRNHTSNECRIVRFFTQDDQTPAAYGLPFVDQEIMILSIDSNNQWTTCIAFDIRSATIAIKKKIGTTWNNWVIIGGERGYGFYKSNASAFNVTTTRVTYGSIRIVTHGRPVFVICSGDFNPTAATAWMNMWLIRDGVGLSHDIVESHANSWNIPFCISCLDIVPAGTHTYQVDFLMGSNTANLAENGALQQPDFSVFEI